MQQTNNSAHGNLLRPARSKLKYARVGIYGRAGAGKTYTAALLAVGLYKLLNLKKPVAVFDTEPSFSWVLPLFEKEGIEVLLSDEHRDLVSLLKFYREAQEVADLVIVDSVTHPWRDLQQAYLDKINGERERKGQRRISRLELHHWGPIKSQWARFSKEFVYAPVHAIICGRAGEMYEYVQDNDGKKSVIATGTRMATEKELGHEPSLLIEMFGDIATDDEATKYRQKIVNRALIEKDRGHLLNGKEFLFPTFEDLRPHFELLKGDETTTPGDPKRAQELFDPDGKDDFIRERKSREILSEEIAGLLASHYPGQSADHKRNRQDLLLLTFDTYSWTKIAEETPSEKLASGLRFLKETLEDESQGTGAITSQVEEKV